MKFKKSTVLCVFEKFELKMLHIFFLSWKLTFFFICKKKWDFKKVLPIFENCHKFSRFETVFFVFLHPCQFCCSNHVFFIAVWREFHGLVITFFLKIVITKGISRVLYFNIFGQFHSNSSILVKLVYELKITFRPNTLKNNNFSSWVTILLRYIRLDFI